MQVEKLFFNINDNIVQILTQLKQIQTERLILVFPVDSMIFFGVVNLKLILKYSTDNKCATILVTEDTYGFKLAQKAGLVAVRKISQITPDLWLVSEKRAFTQHVKNSTELLDEPESIPTQLYIEHSTVNLSQLNPPQAFDLEEEDLINAEIDEVEEISDSSEMKDEDVVEINGLAVFIRSDIQKSIPNPDIISNMQNSKNISPQTSNNLLGMDMSKVIKVKSRRNIFSFLSFQRKRKTDLDSTASDEKPRVIISRRRLIIILLVLIVTLLTATILLLQLVSAEISVTFKKQDVEESFELVAVQTSNSTGYIDGNLTTRFYLYTAADVSTSKTVNISETTKLGEKAKGNITFYNLTEKDLSIPKGTKVISSVGGKAFLVLQDTIVPAVKENALGEKVPQSVADVPIEAESFGDQYNILATSGDDNFLIDIAEFKDLTKASGRIFRDIAGGSSRDSYIVLQSDYDKAVAESTDQIKSLLKQRIQNQIPSSQIFLDQVYEIGEIKSTATPAVGQESTDQKFTISMSVSGTAYTLATADLIEAASVYFDNTNSNAEVSILSKNLNPTVSAVEKNGDQLKVNVGFKGNVGVGLSEADIFNMVKGKSGSDASNAISNLDNLDKYSIQFKPGFVPEFLQFIPSDKSRVIIRVN